MENSPQTKMKMTTSTQSTMTPTAMPTISPRESGEGVVAKSEEGGEGDGINEGKEMVRRGRVGGEGGR